MTQDDERVERADSIFEALRLSEAEEQATEAAALERNARQFERIREQLEMRD